MGYSREVYDAAVAELEKRRIEAVNRAAALKDRMTAKYPRVREIETAMASCSVRVARAVLDGGDVDAAVERIKRDNLALQAELAALVGVRRETIGHLENGKYNPSLKLAMDIAQVFGCTVEDLFFFSE